MLHHVSTHDDDDDDDDAKQPQTTQVDPDTGALRKDAVAANLAALENATSRADKFVALNFWPGPMVGFESNQSSPNHGLPVFARHDEANKVPATGTQADIYLWWQAQQLK